MVSDTYPRKRVDLAAYIERSRTGPCFVCRIVAGTDARRDEHLIYRDDFAVAFLNQFSTLVGYVLVAPIEHRTGVVTDFSEAEYLRLQKVIHRVGRAIAQSVPCERLYVLSLGSNQGNAHVHWHLAPLPPGVPYEEQQYRALMMDEKGYLDIPDKDQARLAARIATAVPA